VTPPEKPKQVTVSAESLEEVLAAIKKVADAIAANTAVITDSASDRGGSGRGGGGNGTDPTVRQPLDIQSRTIVDYLVVSQLLSRLGFDGRVVQARREGGKKVRLRNVPTAIDNKPVVPKKALVTPRAGAAETVDLRQDSLDPKGPRTAKPDPSLKFFTLQNIQDNQEIVRIELQDESGVPLALGPRLAPLTSGFGGGGGTTNDVGGT
jgi:hypothetical protein